MKWDVSSITQLIAAGLSLFVQFWGAIHGASVDPTHVAVGVGLAASGYGHATNNGSINGRP